MSHVTSFQAILDRFKDNWSATSYVQWEQSRFTKPVPSSTNVLGSSWVRISVQYGSAPEGTLNASVTRILGIVFVQCFVPSGSDPTHLRTLADSVSTIFNKQQFNGIVCRESSLQRLPDDDGWQQLTVSTPFWYDV